MVRKTTLQNELRVVAKKLDSTKAVTVLVLAGAGSRYETIEINGIQQDEAIDMERFMKERQRGEILRLMNRDAHYVPS